MESTLSEIAGFDILPLLEVVAVIAVAFGLNFVATRRYATRKTMQTRLQVIQALLLITALILIVIVAPIGDTRRGQLLSFLGIVISAAIALSSTTVLGNAMAGLMLRSIKAFKPGDYMHIGEYAGRVTEMDLLHTEIQNEDSDLMTLSNIYLVTHPYRVIRSLEGTILSVSVSLGYDVPRERVEELLLGAIKEAGLQKPFVHVTELGDFAVSYRAAGLLQPAKALIENRAKLRAAALDALHAGGVEIVSPNFMNTRAISPDTPIIPKKTQHKAVEAESAPSDDVVFDKAEEAESLESIRERHKEMGERIAAAKEQLKTAANDDEKAALTAQIEQTTKKAELLAELIEKRQEKLENNE